ncbi:MAG: DUF302 domain-containing protein [Epsilonproteobacteria bacterium]|nr:MAG: DUF302 domain-containing protein [Campylobacterota bacterium]
MKKVLLLVSLLLIFAGCENKKGTFIKTVQSPYTTEEGVKKFEEILEDKGLSVFQVIDHAQNAKHSEMELLPNTLVVFGNPKMGTVLMQCNPTMGMDLPLKMVFYTDYTGVSWISYTNPEYYTLKHNIKDKNCLAVITKANKALQTLAEALSKANTPIQINDVNIVTETKESK